MIDADANQGWQSAAWTVQSLRRYASCDNLSIEQPLPYADLDGHVHVRRAAGVPVILMSPCGRRSRCCRSRACRLATHRACSTARWVLQSMKAVASASANTGSRWIPTLYAHRRHRLLPHRRRSAHYPVDCEGHVSFRSRPTQIHHRRNYDKSWSCIPSGRGGAWHRYRLDLSRQTP
jgi:hypothetical protein